MKGFQAMILWQDGTTSDERTVSFDPYDNVDDYDVWPGDRVSYLPSEGHLECNGRPFVHLSKVGIVQSVHSSKRTANVRWFLPCHLVIDDTPIKPMTVALFPAVSVYSPYACFIVPSIGPSHTRDVERWFRNGELHNGVSCRVETRIALEIDFRGSYILMPVHRET